MFINPAVARPFQFKGERQPQSLAATITKAASKQSYYIVRFLVDRGLVPAAFQAYAYFRWVDDRLDLDFNDLPERLSFVHRQCSLLGRCLRRDWPTEISTEEHMLVNLTQNDGHVNSGLVSYLRHMMAVMEFDARRRNAIISQEELDSYTHDLATAVTDALHYFIGNGCFAPQIKNRHFAAAGAHITHMLRDTFEDLEAGYFNIPSEVLEEHQISPWDVTSRPYREWVKRRVNLARVYFATGCEYLSNVQNLRCRLAGYTYIGRFEPVLDAIEREDYFLRHEYPECKSLSSALQIGLSAILQSLSYHPVESSSSHWIREER